MSIWSKERIRLARELKEISITDAAEGLSVTREYLSMIENGHREPSQKLVRRMADYYGQTVPFFFDAVDNSAPA